MKKLPLHLIILLILSAFTNVHGQNLMTDPGTAVFNVSVAGTTFNSVFDSDGEIKATSSALHSILNAKVSVGISEHLSLLTNLPLGVYNHIEASSTDPGGLTNDKSVFHPGDLEAGIRLGIKPEDNFSAAFTYMQSFGTGKRDELYGLNTGYTDFNSQLRFHIRYSKNPRFIFQTYMGYVKRYKGFSDEFHAGITGWYIPSSQWKLEAAMAGIQPMKDPEDNSNIYLHGLYHNYAGQLAGTGKLFFTPGEVQTYLGFTQLFRGQFIYASPIIEIGVIFKIGKTGHSSKTETPKDDAKLKD